MHFKLKYTAMRYLSLLGVLMFLACSVQAQEIFGKWKTIDDETNKPRSIVEIYKQDGKAYGKIIKLFRERGEDPNPVCDKCTDYRKDQLVIGMTIIKDMEVDGKEWEDGDILDPDNGKVYSCKLWIEGDELMVRGYVAFFFRTQTWQKVN